ncbi:hypothetical protein BANRA_01952 [Acinetobacter baumannii]|nr:hypothetical protein BANRA_01952 [Acinetobacter baumannii]
MANVFCIFLTILKVNNFLQTRLIFESLLLINQKKLSKHILFISFTVLSLFLYIFRGKEF